MTTTDTHQHPLHLSELEQVQVTLDRAAQAAFRDDDWRTGQRLERLSTLADYMRRVARGDSTPYRAEKSGVLASTAVELDLGCIDEFLPDDERDARVALHHALADHLTAVRSTLRRVAVSNAIGQLCSEDAQALSSAVELLARFTASLLDLDLPPSEAFDR